MIRKIWSMVLVLLLALGAKAQYINVYLTDSTSESYSLADIRKIDFEQDEMIFHFIGGSNLSWNTSIVHYIDYDDLGLGVIPPTAELVQDFVVYPNPSNGPVNVQFEANSDSDIEVSIYNLEGRIMSRLYLGKAANKPHLIQWNGLDNRGNAVANGLYLCAIRIGAQRISRTIILTGK